MELIECVNAIPGTLNRIADQSDMLLEILRKRYKKPFQHIVFIGSGTSYNASNVTKYFAKKVCNLRIDVIYPEIFKSHYTIFDQDALYVVVSQGGSTKLVYEVLADLNKKGFETLSITESLDCILAHESKMAILMGCEKEAYVYRTLGYSSAVATIMMFETCLAVLNGSISKDKKEEIVNDLKKASGNLKEIQTISHAWYKTNHLEFLKQNTVFLAGEGYLFETANEADIKLMEMVPIVTRSFELEEFIHGPQNCFNNSQIFLLLVDASLNAKKVNSIYDFLNNEIGCVYRIGDFGQENKDCVFEFASENFKMLEEITVFQVLAYDFAKDRGRDLNVRLNSSIENYIRKTV